MGKVFKRLPSPSMGVAFIALLAALGGTAVALPGGNSVKKDDIAAGAVNSSDIRNNAVTSTDIRNSTVRGRDVRGNTLTGSDVAESSLGTVPSANTANNANTANTAGSAGSAGSVDGANFAKLLRAVLQRGRPHVVGELHGRQCRDPGTYVGGELAHPLGRDPARQAAG